MCDTCKKRWIDDPAEVHNIIECKLINVKGKYQTKRLSVTAGTLMLLQEAKATVALDRGDVGTFSIE